MKKLKQKAKEYFEENLSGEPLTQEAVEEALVAFGQGKRKDQLENSNKDLFLALIAAAILILMGVIL